LVGNALLACSDDQTAVLWSLPEGEIDVPEVALGLVDVLTHSNLRLYLRYCSLLLQLSSTRSHTTQKKKKKKKKEKKKKKKKKQEA